MQRLGVHYKEMLSIHFKVRKKLGGATLILHGSFRTVLHKIDLEIFYHRE